MPLKRGKDETTTDDTEGHAGRFKGIDEAEGADDTEGHGARASHLQPADRIEDREDRPRRTI
ncbi:MAG TPA: hypothetical protein VIY72_11050 [Acidimicrobiales bacterium]